MMIESNIRTVQSQLEGIIRAQYPTCAPHSREFVRRILSSMRNNLDLPSIQGIDPTSIQYGGYPDLARLGYVLSRETMKHPGDEKIFLDGLRRLMSRSDRSLEAFSADDVAILGVAQGITIVNKHGQLQVETSELTNWMISIIDGPSSTSSWSNRIRCLAGDILDNRGRLKASLHDSSILDLSLDLVLRYCWPNQYDDIPVPQWNIYQNLFERILTAPEEINDIETASIYLASLDLLFSQSCARLFPRTDREKLGTEIVHAIVERLERKVINQTRMLIVTIAIFVASFAILIGIVITKWGWDFAEPKTYLIFLFLAVIGWIYLAITGRELSPQAFYDAVLRFRRRRVYKAYAIDEGTIDRFMGNS